MEYYIHKGKDELTHWGIKGMRWGVRRYQRKDGSLTPAGQRRLKKEAEAIKKEEQVLKNRKATQAKIDKLSAKRKALEDEKKALKGDKTKKPEAAEAKPTKKSIKDMTDDELASAIRRAQLEQQYSSLTAQPETTAKGNGFVKEFWNKSAVPAIQEAGKGLIKDSLTKMGKKYLGLESQQTEDYTTKLAKEVKKLTLEKQYKKLTEEAAEASESKAAQQLKKDVEEVKSSYDKVKAEAIATPSNVSSGKKQVQSSTLATDKEWQEFKKKYSWGVEPYARDEV